MGTRSAIIERTKGGYRGVYCHNDGCLSGVGSILQNHYTDQTKVHALIDLGSLSSIGKTIEPGDTCAYCRDRNELSIETRPSTGKTIINVAKKIDHNGYVYIFENGIWTVWLTDKNMYLPLDEALLNETEIETGVPEEPKEVKKEYNCIHCGEPIYPTWYNRNGFERDWKHKNDTWICYTRRNSATPPNDAVWTEPKEKRNGAM